MLVGVDTKSTGRGNAEFAPTLLAKLDLSRNSLSAAGERQLEGIVGSAKGHPQPLEMVLRPRSHHVVCSLDT
jgi:hypothetical protein